MQISGAAEGGVGRSSSNLITLNDAPILRHVTVHGPDVQVTVQTSKGMQSYTITPTTRVLGRDGRFLDRLALSRGDFLLRRGNIVQDESADAATVRGTVALVDPDHQILVLHTTTTLSGSAALHITHTRVRDDVVLVLLSPNTRLLLPRGRDAG